MWEVRKLWVSGWFYVLWMDMVGCCYGQDKSDMNTKRNFKSSTCCIVRWFLVSGFQPQFLSRNWRIIENASQWFWKTLVSSMVYVMGPLPFQMIQHFGPWYHGNFSMIKTIESSLSRLPRPSMIVACCPAQMLQGNSGTMATRLPNISQHGNKFGYARRKGWICNKNDKASVV